MKPRITFGIIVLNGEPFIRYNLRALYPFAHQIIVVEGACPGAKNICTNIGHSLDSTLDTLWEFKKDEDPEDKLLIVTAVDDGYPSGFWPEKDHMSQAYAKRATGNYIWQIDGDEFYKSEEMSRVIDLLERDPEITAVTFRTHTFWGGLKYKVDSKSLKVMIKDVHRIFSWGTGYQYLSHRPPTVVNANGQNLKQIHWLSAEDMANHGVYMYHYAFLLPKQVEEKCNYYFNSSWAGGKELSSLTWAKDSYFDLKHPFKVYYNNSEWSWLEKYNGEHPQQIVEMIEDVKSGKFPGIDVRRHDDIDEILNSYYYIFRRIFVKLSVISYAKYYKFKLALRNNLLDTPLWPIVQWLRHR